MGFLSLIKSLKTGLKKVFSKSEKKKKQQEKKNKKSGSRKWKNIHFEKVNISGLESYLVYANKAQRYNNNHALPRKKERKKESLALKQSAKEEKDQQ